MTSGSSSKKKKHRRSNIDNYSSSSMPPPSSPSFSCRTKILFIIPFVASLALLYIAWNTNFDSPSTRFYSIQVVNEFPHDPEAFTQGLLYGGNDTLFESTGLYGRSSVRKVALKTGEVELLHQMDGKQFGEGLTLLGERLLQVTWLTKTGFIYDRHNLSNIQKFTHQMRDGWGLATDGEVVYGSDGSSTLYELDRQSFKVVGKATVKYEDNEVHNLNELEYILGEVWANVWSTDCIARISPKDGVVLGWILLPELRERLIQSGYGHIDVLNGIAFDSEENRLFVTGKQWPKLYEIKLLSIGDKADADIEKLCIRKQSFRFAEP